jgi:hypothetical protein
LRPHQVPAYGLAFLFRQFLQPFPHRLIARERSKEDQGDFLRRRVLGDLAPSLVHCTL